ncbi:DNA repair protein RecO [Clostridiaceae bacterium NSJ-31]|uniref:DNA repair protein RecO n=1 Tax=Ligaoa zhengdingensis TaxID=2763658 RepID=A0A926HZ56_9FIRM|nr:DNA repair protein RecO [Ligaoa zhengdingensis]MBC8545567.1 DNA repair protein RecO [Ligaoa zhengdingensis]
MQMTTQAVVIGTRNIEEEDRLLTLLSRDLGVIHAYAKGANRMKSRLAPTTELLCYSSFVLFKNKDRYTVDHADSLNLFFGLRQDVEKLSLATYFAELTATVAPQSEGAEDFLRLLLNTLFLLEKGKRSADFLKPVFELRALTLAGYMPNLVACRSCGRYEAGPMTLLLTDGELLCAECLAQDEPDTWKRVPLPEGVLAAMRHILYSPLERLFQFGLSQEGLRSLGSVTERYLLEQTEKNYATLDFYKSLR